MPESISTDVLIIGAGAAGIRAALAASEAGADVMVVADGPAAVAGSTFSPIARGWGIQALVGSERTDCNLEYLYNEIIRIGLGRCDPKLVRILVEESGQRVEDLLSYGVRFKKDADGEYIRVKGCFSKVERAYITDDFQILKQSFKSRLSDSNIKFLKGRIVDLITEDQSCWGAWIHTEACQLVQINAHSTILATGGGAGIFSDNLVGSSEEGDGYAIAHRAGAELSNLEFIQFMIGLKQDGTRRFFPIPALEKTNTLMNSLGQDILEKYTPDIETRQRAVKDKLAHAPFSCRDMSHVLDTSIARERMYGRKIHFHSDDSRDQPKVVHFAHAFNGGIVIDEHGESTVAGLYAAGEVAAGPHGADRVGGCMMTATQVFGERAGRFAALRAKSIRARSVTRKTPHLIKRIINQSVNSRKDNELKELSGKIRYIFSENLMILRSRQGLSACLREINETDAFVDKIGDMNQLDRLHFKDMLITMQLIASSALNREKSLGSHYRTDSIP